MDKLTGYTSGKTVMIPVWRVPLCPVAVREGRPEEQREERAVLCPWVSAIARLFLLSEASSLLSCLLLNPLSPPHRRHTLGSSTDANLTTFVPCLGPTGGPSALRWSLTGRLALPYPLASQG